MNNSYHNTILQDELHPQGGSMLDLNRERLLQAYETMKTIREFEVVFISIRQENYVICPPLCRGNFMETGFVCISMTRSINQHNCGNDTALPKVVKGMGTEIYESGALT